MPIVATSLIGRFGNKLFQYCHARALAEQTGAELHTPEWIGEKIFDLPSVGRDISNPIGGYRQDQASLIYTRKQVKEWLRFKPEVENMLSTFVAQGGTVAHRRVGDYLSLGYPVVSEESYRRAAFDIGVEKSLRFVTEENPLTHPYFHGELAFLPDFYLMMKASVLFRGNSSFSFWSAVLGDDAQSVYSPVIDEKPGGVESDCEFVKGNHPRFCLLEFVTDLHMAPG